MKVTISGPEYWFQRFETIRLLVGVKNRSKFLRDIIERGLEALIKERTGNGFK